MAPSSLHERLKTLYPLACLLVGPDDAPDLLLRAYGQVVGAFRRGALGDLPVDAE